MDKNKKIKELMAKGFTRNQSAMMCLMQEGGYYDTYNPYFMQNPGVKNPFENTSYQNAPQVTTPPIDYNKEYMAMTTEQEHLSPLTVPEAEQEQPTTKPEIYNPFGGVSLESALYTAGQGLGEKDPWKASTGIGLSALKIGRTGLAGYATGRENARVAQEMQRKQFEDMRRPQMRQEGGSISNAAVMTGKFLVDNPNGGNVNIETGEIVKDNQTGDIKTAVGEDHKNGGINTTLEDAKILSDYTKIGAKNAKELKDKYNLSVKKTDTFAKVMDKFNKKIGVNELVDEQTEYIEKLGANEAIKSQGTKKVNDEFLNKEIKDKEEKLNALKNVQNFAFEDIFARQESIPKKGDGKTLLDAKGNPMQEKGTEILQEGGHVYNLAKKYNITPERAMQLLQEGGNYNKNSYQEGGEQGVSPEEIVTAYAESTQQDPNTIIEQLQQLPPEEQQAAIQQMAEQLQGGQASQQEQGVSQEQVAQAIQRGADPNEVIEQLIQSGVSHEEAMGLVESVAQQPVEQSQEMMQEGGEKYDPNYPYGKSWTKEDKKLRYEAALQQARLLGYSGKLTNKDYDKDKAWGELQKFLVEKAPAETEAYAKSTRLTAKGIGNLKNIDPNIFKAAGVPANKPNDDYSEQEAALLSEEAKKSSKLPKNFWLDEFNDYKGAYRYPMVGTYFQPQGVVQGTQAQVSAPSMTRFASTPLEAQVPEAEQVELAKAQAVKGNMVAPNLPVDFLLPPSAMQAINKPYVPLGRIQPVKLTAEPALAEGERQRQTSLEALRATGLPPQVQEALSAGQLASSQGAANEAIAKTEQFNAQNQYQTDQFNIGQASKEDLMNTQYAQDYQDKMMATLANQERDMRRYYSDLNQQNRANFNYIDRRNIANEAFENFSTTGSDVTYNPTSKVYTMPGGTNIKAEVWDNMTAEERAAETKRRTNEINAKAMKSYQKA